MELEDIAKVHLENVGDRGARAEDAIVLTEAWDHFANLHVGIEQAF